MNDPDNLTTRNWGPTWLGLFLGLFDALFRSLSTSGSASGPDWLVQRGYPSLAVTQVMTDKVTVVRRKVSVVALLLALAPCFIMTSNRPRGGDHVSHSS
jgi:hypothetical protein